MAPVPQSPGESEFYYSATKKISFIFPCREAVMENIDI